MVDGKRTPTRNKKDNSHYHHHDDDDNDDHRSQQGSMMIDTIRRLEFCKSLPFPYVTITAYAPTAGIGGIIGKKGSKIANLEKRAAKLLTEPISRDQLVRVSIVHHQSHYHSQKDQSQHQQQQHDNEHNNETTTVSSSVSDRGSSAGVAPSPTATSQSSSSIQPNTFTELDFSSSDWTPIVIRSTPLAAFFVATSIDEICSDFVNDPTTDLSYIVDLPLLPTTTTIDNNNNNNNNNNHTKTTCAIIGKRGQTIGKLSADNDCRIFVPTKKMTTDRTADVIQLEGPLMNCISCLQDLGEVLSS